MPRARIVTIDTRTLGDSFATAGIVRYHGRIIYTGIERPYGFIEAAQQDARDWAEAHGYTVEEEEE